MPPTVKPAPVDWEPPSEGTWSTKKEKGKRRGWKQTFLPMQQVRRHKEKKKQHLTPRNSNKLNYTTAK
jgi:hypothetical protein